MITTSVARDGDTVQITARAKYGDLSVTTFITLSRDEVISALWTWDAVAFEVLEVPGKLLAHGSGLSATVAGQTTVMTSTGDCVNRPSVVAGLVRKLREAIK